ncbi:hypothetical protein A0H81_07652 [Grifola frondosa]|uniref:Uncharacterized protein n=1 Tax=Grifola frondosa TaxID=5627 RepID=A0A1C7M5E2_GRIFR|nr:hypothetical protein A0H81_07652 [Grifola frondosa]
MSAIMIIRLPERPIYMVHATVSTSARLPFFSAAINSMAPERSFLIGEQTSCHPLSLIFFGSKDRCGVVDFAREVYAADNAARGLPIAAFETCQATAPNDPTFRMSAGIFGHHFAVATVFVKNGQHPHGTYSFIRMDFLKDQSFDGHTIAQTVRLSDDHPALVKDAKRLARLARELPSSGPSLDALTCLLEIVYSRTYSISPVQGPFAWGEMDPEWALRKYIVGESDAVTCSTELSVDGGTVWRSAQVGSKAVRGMQAFFTAMMPDRIVTQDEEILQVQQAWNTRMPAIL